ncbi:MAG: asparaginase [Hyphomicrobium sp.]|jgi:L-asparaginase II
MPNPVLIEVTRGPLVESWHRGAVAIAAPSGALALRLGDVERTVYPRSAVKALQALPLIESGTADRFGFGLAEIALACGSHAGTERHTQLAGAMLDRAGLNPDALGCGAHMPLGSSAANALIAAGKSPTQLHNNCSGKHAGMLATAVHLGEPTAGYWDAKHPVQQRVHEALCDITGLPLGADVQGIDGCSVPNWAMPLSVMARAFAKLVTGDGMTPERRAAVKQILDACWEYPDMVAGKSRADTVVMRALPRQVFMKTGAEGVYCGAFPELGLGFALKIDDGTKRAAAGAAMALVEQLYPAARGLMPVGAIKTWHGQVVGGVRSSPLFEDALAGLKVTA